ncbi:MAG: type VI secretion system tip protein VgrG [Planctomycetes bacterium]|nr:type VI secretion system tip protein VgrG [Planctomycetota bacterium]
MADAKHVYELLLNATDKGLDELEPLLLSISEGMSRPYLATLTARTYSPTNPGDLDPAAWLRKKVSVCLSRNDEESWTHGIVLAVEHLGEDQKGQQLYRIEIGPILSLLRNVRRSRVFTDMKPIDVVRSVLQEGGVPQFDIKAAGAAGQAMRHVTQFEETDFDFVSRLLEQEGASYWFTHTKTSHTMVIGDAVSHHPGSAAAVKSTYSPEGASIGSDTGVVTHIARRHEVVSMYTAVRDYSESHPKSPATGSKTIASNMAPGATGKLNEADYHVTQSDGDATAYANRLADRQANRSCRLVGAGDALGFRAGVRAAIDGRDGYDEHVLITEITHGFKDGSYRNEFSAMPVSRLPWRPQRTTPIPRIDGVIPAIVTATAGDQGNELDGYYRVKILNSDETKDRIVRMAQPYAGPAQGIHFPLPVNTEVLLAHEYGHPDRPIIAGALHNAEDPSQVLDANKTQCVVRSAAGAFLIFEDKQDEEKITLKSKASSMLEIDDKPDAEKITLQSKAAAKLVIDDLKDDERILLQSKAAGKLEISDKPKEEKTILQSMGGAKLEMQDKPDEEKITLQSKKGHSFVLDDKNGSEKVTLLTKGTQKLEFDDKSGSELFTLFAKKDHKVEVKGKSDTTVTGKKTIDCQDEIEISAATKITLKVGGNSITISSSAIEIACSGNISIKADANVDVKATANATVAGLNATLKGDVAAKVSGGAQAEVSASGQTAIKGAIVMIN